MKHSQQKGFSIIEMMVAVALFTMVVMMSIAAMITLIDANQKARSVKTAIDNLNFVVDDISRNLRLGSKYFCQTNANSPIVINPVSANLGAQDCLFNPNDPDNVNLGGPYLAFRDRVGKIILYRHSGTGCIQKKVTNQNWNATVYTDNPSSGYSCITPSDVTVDRFRFYVSNTSPSSDAQPFAAIVIRGTAGTKASTKTSFNIMTSVTQRIPHEGE